MDKKAVTAASAVNWGGIQFRPMRVESAVTALLSDALSPHSHDFHLCNSWTVALAQRDQELAKVLRSGHGINLVDGVPLARVLSVAPYMQYATTRGPDLFLAGTRAASAAGLTQTFYGATDTALAQLRKRFMNEGWDVSKMHFLSPPFQPLSVANMSEGVKNIMAHEPQIVWVGLGTPKQDIFADFLTSNSEVTSVAVGAAFDFAAGTVAEAPAWVRGSGFEWLYRFSREPKRLWRRYTLGNITFIRLALQHRPRTASF